MDPKVPYYFFLTYRLEIPARGDPLLEFIPTGMEAMTSRQ